MKLTTQSFLYELSRSSNAIKASVVDNCRFDERVANQRWQEFEKRLLKPSNPTWEDWCETSNLHYQDKVTVSSTSVPDSFLTHNQPAWLKNIATNRTVVRLEHLERFLTKEHLSFDELHDLLVSTDPDKKVRLAEKIEAWNGLRDGRPSFATFYDEVQAEADHDDWQHQLRDRLGLGHYSSKKGVKIPVALMRYVLKEVKQCAVPCAFALPTVLDGGMHEFFFPVPCSHPYGATLHLAANQADTLTAEILHYRIAYQPEHLWKIGWITRPHNVKDNVLRDARDLHLVALQTASKNKNFGELMEGRK